MLFGCPVMSTRRGGAGMRSRGRGEAHLWKLGEDLDERRACQNVDVTDGYGADRAAPADVLRRAVNEQLACDETTRASMIDAQGAAQAGRCMILLWPQHAWTQGIIPRTAMSAISPKKLPAWSSDTTPPSIFATAGRVKEPLPAKEELGEGGESSTTHAVP